MRLIGAVLFEQNDEWQTSSRYMMVEAFAQIDKEEIDPILSITTKSRLIMTSGHPENYTSLTDATPIRCGDMRPFRQIASTSKRCVGETNSSWAATVRISREPASSVRFSNPKIEAAASARAVGALRLRR